jgi:hypothetical protein
MTNPEAPSTAPVAWCQSEDFRNALFKRQSFSGWREQHTDCDTPLYAHPQASAIAPDAAQAKGPSLDDVDDLCEEFEFHLEGDGLEILQEMIAAAITRWPAPVAQPAAQPVNLAELHDPDFSDGLTPSQHLDVLAGGADPRVASTAAAPEEAGSESKAKPSSFSILNGPKTIIHDSLGRKLDNVLYCDPQTGEVISYVTLDRKGRLCGDRHEILPCFLGQLLRQREFYPAPLTIEIEPATNDNA